MSKLTDKEWSTLSLAIANIRDLVCETYTEAMVYRVILYKTITWKKASEKIPTASFLFGELRSSARGSLGTNLSERVFRRAKAALIKKGVIGHSGGKYWLNAAAILRAYLRLLEDCGQDKSSFYVELLGIRNKVASMKGFRMPTMEEILRTPNPKTEERKEKKAKVTTAKEGSRATTLQAFAFLRSLCKTNLRRTYPELSWDDPEDVPTLGYIKKLTEDPKWKDYLSRCVTNWKNISQFLRAFNGEDTYDFVSPEILCKHRAIIEKYLSSEHDKDYSQYPTADEAYFGDLNHVETHNRIFARYRDQ